MNDDSWEFNVGRIFSPDQIRENQRVPNSLVIRQTTSGRKHQLVCCLEGVLGEYHIFGIVRPRA